MHFKTKLYKHCHNYIPYNLMEITNTTYTRCARRLIITLIIAVWLCLLLPIYLLTLNYIVVVTVCNATTHWNCTCSWWHIRYILVLDYYPLTAGTTQYMQQPFILQNLILSCSVSMALCDHFSTHVPAHIKILR